MLYPVKQRGGGLFLFCARSRYETHPSSFARKLHSPFLRHPILGGIKSMRRVSGWILDVCRGDNSVMDGRRGEEGKRERAWTNGWDCCFRDSSLEAGRASRFLFWYTIILFCRLIGIIVVHCWTDEFVRDAWNQPAWSPREKETLLSNFNNTTVECDRQLGLHVNIG